MKLLRLCPSVLVVFLASTTVLAQGPNSLEFSFSNPGARAIALGGAFVGLADDATAAFANPAGLVQLAAPEVSVEGRGWSYETPFTVGGNLQIFGFTEDLNDGYFDPDFYGLLEGLGRWQQTYNQKWTFFTEFAPGMQKIRADGSLGATVRITGRVAYGISPGREISVSGVFASTGIQSFSTEPGSYRYRAATFGGSWMF